MTIVDTHCHLHFDAFDTDREAVIDRARGAGVEYLINVGTDPGSNEKAHELALRYPFMRHTAGLHPHSAHEINEAGFIKLEKYVNEKKPSAIGEIGLDYFKSEASPAVQKKVFARMIQIAKSARLPVIVHSRNAFDDTYEILRAESGGSLRGVMHCFSYDETALKKLMDIGFLASFTCNLTFKNAQVLLDVATFAPLDGIMLETDSPYLAPQSCRGRRNEPSFLTELVMFLSQKKGILPETLAHETTNNALRFFGIH
jgi:TatD DNase family protein